MGMVLSCRRSFAVDHLTPPRRIGKRRVAPGAAPSWDAQTQSVAVGILEPCDLAPRKLEHLRLELHSARLQRLDRLPDIVRLDRVRRRDAAVDRLSLPGRARPENELEVLALDADGQESRPVRRRIVEPWLEAEDVGVEVERPVLVAYEHRGVDDSLEHGCSSRVRGHYLDDHGRAANVTAAGRVPPQARTRARLARPST